MRSGLTSVESRWNSMKLKPPKARRVLILSPARELHVDALDAVRQLGDSRSSTSGRRSHSLSTPINATTSVDDEPSPDPGGASECTTGRRRLPTLQRPHHRLDEIEVAVETHAPRMVVLGDHVVVEARDREPRVAARRAATRTRTGRWSPTAPCRRAPPGYGETSVPPPQNDRRSGARARK